MINVIKSDFYKLFKRKSFYICLAIALLLTVLGIILVMPSKEEIDSTISYLPVKSINFFANGLSESTLFITILISMFVPCEFAFGTIKNIASRGIDRFKIYLSKLLVCSCVSVIYSLVCAIVGFCTAAIMIGVDGFNQEMVMNIFRMFGLFILAQISYQSFIVMLGFLIRNVGGTISVSLAISILEPVLLIPVINLLADKWFHYDLNISEYLSSNYVSSFANLDISTTVINKGVTVCLIYLILTTAIGIVDFYNRDIK